MPTIRKEIAELLEKGPLDLREISQILRIREKEVLDHLQHIARSVHPRKLAMDPAACLRLRVCLQKAGAIFHPQPLSALQERIDLPAALSDHGSRS